MFYQLKIILMSLIQKGDGDIWNKYVDLGEQTDTEKLGTFDITNVKYKKTFELLTATSEDIKNKVINVSVSDENTEEDQNYNHQIKSELFKRIEFDIESFKQDLAKDSIKTMHKYNIYKGYDTLRVNISFNTGTSSSGTLIHLTNIMTVKIVSSKLEMNFVGIKYGKKEAKSVYMAAKDLGNITFSENRK